jgi:hypothetical protein
MNWWTTGKVILVTVCGCVATALVAGEINEALANAAAEKTRRLVNREGELTARERERTLQKQAEAEKARYEAERASMACACDQCVNFADANELKKAEQEVG